MEPEVLLTDVAGVDVHKEKLVIATIVVMEDKTIRRSTWGPDRLQLIGLLLGYFSAKWPTIENSRQQLQILGHLVK